jgi:hypothetical protein
LAFILGHGLHVVDRHLSPSDIAPSFTPLQTAYSGLQEYLSNGLTFKGPVTSETDCQAIVRGSLALYGMVQPDQAHRLLSTVSFEESCEKALIEIVRGHFADPSWEPAPF